MDDIIDNRLDRVDDGNDDELEVLRFTGDEECESGRCLEGGDDGSSRDSVTISSPERETEARMSRLDRDGAAFGTLVDVPFDSLSG